MRSFRVLCKQASHRGVANCQLFDIWTSVTAPSRQQRWPTCFAMEPVWRWANPNQRNSIAFDSWPRPLCVVLRVCVPEYICLSPAFPLPPIGSPLPVGMYVRCFISPSYVRGCMGQVGVNRHGNLRRYRNLTYNVFQAVFSIDMYSFRMPIL
jgi:hypothetical protein